MSFYKSKWSVDQSEAKIGFDKANAMARDIIDSMIEEVRVLPSQVEATNSDEFNAEKSFWKHFLVDSYMELLFPRRHNKFVPKGEKVDEIALSWFMENRANGIGTVKWVCTVLNVDLRRAREVARRFYLLAQSQPNFVGDPHKRGNQHKISILLDFIGKYPQLLEKVVA